ncbi:MAG: hypothetical protein AB7K67_10345 [Hyphomicrobiaceae bacterium]
MTYTRLAYALAMMLGVLGLATAAEAQRGRDNWELLGTKSVGFGVDRDVIPVGAREGRYSRILLEVKGNDVYMLDLKVVYANNQVDDVPVRQLIKAGTRTRAIDLKGDARMIQRIEMVYRSRPSFRGQAVVQVYGEQVRGGPGMGMGPGPGGGRWENLGCQKVGFLVDRDVVRVGRQEGRFSAIRLKVSGNAIYMSDLKVVYANGAPDNIQVRNEIRAGGETRPLDLRGDRRAIRQIEMVYRAKPNFRGQATVCVEGRQ